MNAQNLLKQFFSMFREAIPEQHRPPFQQIPFLGSFYSINILFENDKNKPCFLSDDGHINLTLDTVFYDNSNHRLEAETILKLWLKKQARVFFPSRVEFWCEKMGVCPQKVSISSPLRQWGSCSADNIIRLNWRLIMLPVELLDYVVAHELAHITHKHHQPSFWQCVAQAMPDYLSRRRALRKWEKESHVLRLFT